MEAKPLPSKFMAEVLTACAKWVANTLNVFDIDSKGYSFAVLIWPVGQPERVSSIGGSANIEAQAELPAACTAAGEKAKGEPTHHEHFTSGPAGHA